MPATDGDLIGIVSCSNQIPPSCSCFIKHKLSLAPPSGVEQGYRILHNDMTGVDNLPIERGDARCEI